MHPMFALVPIRQHLLIPSRLTRSDAPSFIRRIDIHLTINYHDTTLELSQNTIIQDGW